MTDQQHPIIPTPELRAQWREEASALGTWLRREEWFIDRAAQWGADQELEACCEWLAIHFAGLEQILRAARRPKPPSLKEQALDELHISFDRGYLKEGAADTIRRALEQLPD